MTDELEQLRDYIASQDAIDNTMLKGVISDLMHNAADKKIVQVCFNTGILQTFLNEKNRDVFYLQRQKDALVNEHLISAEYAAKAIEICNFLANAPDEDGIIWDDAKTGHFTDERDGNVYKVVKIGDQIWMAENFRYIPYVILENREFGISVYNFDSDSLYVWTTESPVRYTQKISDYRLDSINVSEALKDFYYKTFGCLYDWHTACKIAPTGWHLPSIEEWNTLINYLGGKNIAGGKLKCEKHWRNPNIDANNQIGFNALPGGRRWSKRFYDIGIFSGFWTSSQIDRKNACCIELLDKKNNAKENSSFCSTGFSIRYLKIIIHLN